jgi:hypothetical protein
MTIQPSILMKGTNSLKFHDLVRSLSSEKHGTVQVTSVRICMTYCCHAHTYTGPDKAAEHFHRMKDVVLLNGTVAFKRFGSSTCQDNISNLEKSRTRVRRIYSAAKFGLFTTEARARAGGFWLNSSWFPHKYQPINLVAWFADQPVPSPSHHHYKGETTFPLSHTRICRLIAAGGSGRE